MSNTMPQNCEPCLACNGTGNASGHYQVDDGSQQMPKFCLVCKGHGYVRQDVSPEIADLLERQHIFEDMKGSQS
jgi:DnaJ-class molecular chaperone